MSSLSGFSFSFGNRLPTILQGEAAECGLACLAMLAHHHGYRTDLVSLRRMFPISRRGTTLASLMDIAHRLDFATRAVRVELEDLDHLRSPCILHWNFNHFVVLTSVSRSSVTIIDPARGPRTLSKQEVSKSFTGVALEVWPSDSFVPREHRQAVKLRALMGRVTGLRRSLGQILGLALALEVFSIVSPFFMQWLVDNVLVSGDRSLLATLAIGFGLLVIAQQAIAASRAWMVMYVGTTLNVQWRANAFSHLLKLPTQFFEKRHVGDIFSRFTSIDVIQHTLTSSFLEAILDGIMTIATLMVIFIYSPLLSMVSVGAVLLYALGRWIWYRPLWSASQEQIVHAATQQSHFWETIRGIRAIQLFQRQSERRAAWLAVLVDQINAELRGQKLQLLNRTLNGLLFGLENVIVIWLGARMVLDGDFSVGMLIAFVSYKGQFGTRVSSLIDRLYELKLLQLQGERLADIVLTSTEATASDSRLNLSEHATQESAIEVRNLRFRYAEHEPYVLDGVDLKIPPGESIAIVGASGCGKSTLVHLMLGALAPTEGEILYGGSNIWRLGPAHLPQTVAAVIQNDSLFEGSISDNINFFDAQPDQEWVEECAKLALIHEDIVAMPMAYNTFVGFMGSVLSGGQKQRLLLARALYRRPKILFLDEATSHLDVECELQLNAAVRSLRMTRIIVAHRPQTIETADRIVRIEGGKIVEPRPAIAITTFR